MSAVGAAEARAALPELLTRVERGEQVTITRHGRAVAVLVSPKDVRRRRAGDAFDAADRIDVLLSEAATTGWPDEGGLTAERAETLIAEIRAGRDSW